VKQAENSRSTKHVLKDMAQLQNQSTHCEVKVKIEVYTLKLPIETHHLYDVKWPSSAFTDCTLLNAIFFRTVTVH